MTIAVFNTEVEVLEYLANLLCQEVGLSFKQLVEVQAELDKVGFYR